MFRAAILDIDGTLVDSNDAHARAWVDALAELGRPTPFERVRPLIGMGSDKLLPKVAGIDASSLDGQRAIRRRREIFAARYLPHLQPTRGAHELLEWLRDERLTLVVATSAEREEVDALLSIAQATKLIDAATSSADVDRSKPDPDVVRAALDQTGCPPQEVVLLGDTQYDLEAAQRAGVGMVGFRCGGTIDALLAGALAIYDDPQDLLDHYALSPFKRPLPLVEPRGPQTSARNSA